MRKTTIKAAEVPVFRCTAVSTKRLCEIKHINANRVISRNGKFKVAIMAIGAYNGKKMLEIKTMAASPGKPIKIKKGVSRVER